MEYQTFTIRWNDNEWPHKHRPAVDKRHQHMISLGGEHCDATMQSIVAGLRANSCLAIKVTREWGAEEDVTPLRPELPHLGDRLATISPASTSDLGKSFEEMLDPDLPC